MAVLRAFRAIRPERKYAEKVISLPYDVMSREEAAGMAANNPYSFLHICRAEIDLPEQGNPYDREVYEKAEANIREFLKKGVFFREEKPMLYLYRQTMGMRKQTGIVGCVSVSEYENGIIKKHELTRVEKELDRINHFDICNANTEPVFLTYKDDLRIQKITEDWMRNHPPEYDFVTEDGIGHVLWAIDDDEVIAALTSLFREIPSLYIADGHHRSASAYKVGLKRREEHPGYNGQEEFNFFMAAVFPASELKIFDYNRVVRDLRGLTAEEFISAVIQAGFTVTKMGKEAYEPEERHIFSMYLEGNWYRLAAKPEVIPQETIAALDVSILQDRVLSPILGIEDPRCDKRIDFVGGIRGLSALAQRCEEDMRVAFAVFPISLSELMEVADQGLVMPPKSTWFEPKLGSGLFLHEL